MTKLILIIHLVIQAFRLLSEIIIFRSIHNNIFICCKLLDLKLCKSLSSILKIRTRSVCLYVEFYSRLPIYPVLYIADCIYMVFVVTYRA